MLQTIFIILFILALLVGFGWLFWTKTRNTLREAKNIERGLKMVPLLIHLPPPSDDVDSSGARDKRDVAEEAISRAQSLYDIIASTAEKGGFKSKLYGQRHISFEIVGYKGIVHFYVAVPIVLVDVVKQGVLSAYPSARLEEVSEHNIFNPVGKISGTSGGEMVLKESYVHPIATFQDSKRDAIQSILNALSELNEEDGVGIQIMLRPADSGWSKKSKDVAKEMREGKQSKKGAAVAGSWVKQLLEALWKPPEASESKDKPPKQLGSLEQAHIDAIESKTRHAAYETLIRVVASSNTSARSQTLMRNIVATFALFDAPGKNGFKFNEAKDIESFVSAYIMRLFPQDINQNVLNSVELATIFHLPEDSRGANSQVERQSSKQVDGPRNMPAKGMILGYNVFRGIKREVRVSENDRRRHIYIVGQTGVGKSTLLENMIVQDMLDGRGLCFVDPHGDSVEKLMGMVPKERAEDIVYFCPADMEYPMGLNMFEFDTPDQKDFLIQEAISMLYRLYDPQRQGIIGPRYEHWFRNAALTVMADPAGSSFIDIPKVFTDNAYAKQKVKHVSDQTVLDFWNKEMASTSDYHKSEILGWFVSKFGAFLSNEMMRNIIGQTKSAFNLKNIMDDGKILFVNLSKGRTGELNSKLLGMIFVMKFQAAAMSRAHMPESERKDFTLYVDEFQNFSTDSFATILSEARKYRLSLVVANQFIGQLTEEIRDAVFGNVGTIVSYRTGVSDSEFLAKQFSPTFEVDDLVKLPNFNAVMRLMIDNVPSQPFSMAVLPPLGHYNPQLADALKRLAIAKYGKPRKVVEKEIFDRLKTEPTPPRMPAEMPRRPMPGQTGPKPGSSSFLDEWLAKRRAEMAQRAAGGGAGVAPIAPGPRPAKPQPAKAPNLRRDQNGLPIPETEISTRQNNAGKPRQPSTMDDKKMEALSREVESRLRTNHKPDAEADKEEPKPADKPPAEEVSNDEIIIDNEGKLHYPNLNLDDMEED